MNMLAFLFQNNLGLLPFIAPPLLLSLTLHEYAHARVALAFGDPTALRAGRVTLNPLKHLDPLGTIMLFIVGFGWAKPVPVNPFNLHPRGLGDFMVSLAGPLTNLALAIIAGCLMKIFLATPAVAPESHIAKLLVTALFFTMGINLVLFTFNLIPLYPLDGHHMLREVLPSHLREGFMRWQLRFGRWGLLALLFGPRLLTMLSPQQNIPNPIGWLIGHVFRLATYCLDLPEAWGF